MTQTLPKVFDIAICGGSFVGLALARALTHLAPGVFRIALIEQRPLLAPTPQEDGRTVAVVASVKKMLEALDVWQRVAQHAEPVLKIELSDTSLSSPVRPSLIELDASEAEVGEPTAYIIENHILMAALVDDIKEERDLTPFAPDKVASFRIEEPMAVASLASGETISARLLVAADGRHSELRSMAGIKTLTWPSGKAGIVATVGLERPHNGIARQHFLPAGPFAILPMTGQRASIVWTEDLDRAQQLVREGDERVLAELSLRIGPELGQPTLLSKPKVYPLTTTLARDFVKPRFALVGDAAHGLHWIAGQGLNHGLKDVAALAETLLEAAKLGLDIGDGLVLKRYERWRRFDSASSLFLGMGLNALFSNDNMALRLLRSSGLRMADRIGPLKSFFMKEAAGFTGAPPKLLKGEKV